MNPHQKYVSIGIIVYILLIKETEIKLVQRLLTINLHFNHSYKHKNICYYFKLLCFLFFNPTISSQK